VATGVAGLSILPRYLTVPAIALTLFAGEALAGWTTLGEGAARLRRRWAGAVAAAAAVGAVFALTQAGAVGRLTTELRFIRGTHEGLAAILREPAVRAGMRCGPLTLPNYRLTPDARWILDASRREVSARSALRRERGVALFFVDRRTLLRYGFADGASPRTNVPDPGFVPAARNGRFAAYVACP
jgi:hypothetical protein